ncbi:helix-turn-helix domain-containing protein [Chachezhania sediminis]|uniref:helix-turn-helix domain-containing protein n=1 Tax=Chachezhania sediminis TaxID=2599291 RepID=UPI00131BD12F|nr:XRE family transcriptional regulator [Chachezhania sediminis]
MTTPAKTLTESRAALARRAKDLRHRKGLTLQDVADRSKLAVSTVSKIERGLISPTYDRFSMLAEGLEVDVSELFAEAGSAFAQGELAVSRPGDEGYLETENYTYEMLFPHVRGKTMVPMLGTLKPLEQMRFDRMVRHPGQEFFHVLEGRVLVQLDGADDVVLEAGESLYFDSRRGHLYASATDGNARILVVCTEIDPAPTRKD